MHGLQIRLFLRLDLLDGLDREVDDGRLVVAGTDVGIGLGKRCGCASQQGCADASTAIAVRHHEGFPERGE